MIILLVTWDETVQVYGARCHTLSHLLWDCLPRELVNDRLLAFNFFVRNNWSWPFGLMRKPARQLKLMPHFLIELKRISLELVDSNRWLVPTNQINPVRPVNISDHQEGVLKTRRLLTALHLEHWPEAIEFRLSPHFRLAKNARLDEIRQFFLHAVIEYSRIKEHLSFSLMR